MRPPGPCRRHGEPPRDVASRIAACYPRRSFATRGAYASSSSSCRRRHWSRRPRGRRSRHHETLHGPVTVARAAVAAAASRGSVVSRAPGPRRTRSHGAYAAAAGTWRGALSSGVAPGGASSSPSASAPCALPSRPSSSLPSNPSRIAVAATSVAAPSSSARVVCAMVHIGHSCRGARRSAGGDDGAPAPRSAAVAGAWRLPWGIRPAARPRPRRPRENRGRHSRLGSHRHRRGSPSLPSPWRRRPHLRRRRLPPGAAGSASALSHRATTS